MARLEDRSAKLPLRQNPTGLLHNLPNTYFLAMFKASRMCCQALHQGIQILPTNIAD